MADPIDWAPLLAQVDAESLVNEFRRRMKLSPVNSTGSVAGPAAASADGGTRDSGTPGHIRSDEFFRLSTPESIRKYLAIMKRPQSPRAIVEGLRAGGVLSNAKNFYANVWTELKRARVRGEVVNTPSGWGLSEWYPNKPKQNELPTSKKKKKLKGMKALKGSSALPIKVSVKATDRPQTWHQFLGEAAKQHKTMQQAAEEWKRLKAK